MTETYQYSLLSSGLGILIVFLALVALSVMMVLLKKFFEPRRKAEAENEPTAAETHEESLRQEAEEVEWLQAAVAAYMILEAEASGAPSAAEWQPGNGERTDPWAGAPVLRRQV